MACSGVAGTDVCDGAEGFIRGSVALEGADTHDAGAGAAAAGARQAPRTTTANRSREAKGLPRRKAGAP